ncbi:E3 ubiquitin-protein ligase ubr1, partial [Spiromyces aspiralis]
MSGSDTALGGSSSLPGEPPAVSSIAMPGKPSYPTVSSSTSEPLDDDESAIDTERAKELLEFLRSSPKHYNYDFTPEVRYEILRKITACLLNNVETVLDMVPIDPRSGRAPMLPPEEEDIPTEYTEVRRGKPCGHVFKPGEGVYRC